MAKILLVEDDPHLSGTIKDWLTFERHNVDHAESGDLGLDFLKSSGYDLIILDWELPQLTGLELCRKFRYKGGKTPILFLTGRDSISDKETGLDAGADDYLTKPFHMRELTARIRSLLRRPPMVGVGTVLKIGEVELDSTRAAVRVGGKELHLPKSEYALLEFFMRHPNQVLPADTIIERVWKSDAAGTPETFRTCLKRLRSKIDAPGTESMIKNVHGLGYVLETPKESPEKKDS